MNTATIEEVKTIHISSDKDLMEWVQESRKQVDQFLSSAGALLVRGLGIDSPELLGKVLSGLFEDELATYTYRSTPRTELKNNVYTATEYHPSVNIPQHNEHSYSNSWPMRIGFLCVTPALKLGNTPICDSRKVYQQVPAEVREEFEKKKVMYVRNYSMIDLPWQEVFQTSEKSLVEAYCRANDMTFEWTEDGLRTRQVNQASMSHPVTGGKVWFNQAHLFHLSSLTEELQQGLLEIAGEENLPRNAYFGDGTPISIEALHAIRKAYDDNMITFQWQKGDLLLLDNMLFTHGREPFEGPRKVLVGMAREYPPVQTKR
jgi:alpha-ketoglutarate-dependent taurine dioxygenase